MIKRLRLFEQEEEKKMIMKDKAWENLEYSQLPQWQKILRNHKKRSSNQKEEWFFLR